MTTDLREKLHYSMQMMSLIGWLSGLADGRDRYVRSVVMRHGLVYLDAFILYGQQLRTVLAQGGSAERRALESIKGDFKELHEDFRASGASGSDHLLIRTELAAHRHDIPVADRLDAWNRIDDSFGDYWLRAGCIYASIAGIDQHLRSFAPSQDESNSELEKNLRAALPQRSAAAVAGVDNLAYVRPGTVVVVEGHEIQRRLAQIMSIIHTIKITGNLYGAAHRGEDTLRLLKAMLVVDVINLAENMYFDRQKRIVTPLLSLAYKHNMQCASVLNSAARDLDVATEDRLRYVRNKIAAHVDAQIPLNELLKLLDGVSMNLLNMLFAPVKTTLLRDCVAADDIVRGWVIMQDVPLPGIKFMDPEDGRA